MTAATLSSCNDQAKAEPVPMQPWDVVFLRAAGARARINMAVQRLLDPALAGQAVAFTHCALALSDRLVLEAYPHAIKGQASVVTHPPGVRIVPFADLLTSSAASYVALKRLRPVAAEGLAVSMFDLAGTMMRHRYGLRRFAGLRTQRGGGAESEWVGCADLVVKMLVAGGLEGVTGDRAIGPGTLWRLLVAAGWRSPEAAFIPPAEGMSSR